MEEEEKVAGEGEEEDEEEEESDSEYDDPEDYVDDVSDEGTHKNPHLHETYTFEELKRSHMELLFVPQSCWGTY